MRRLLAPALLPLAAAAAGLGALLASGAWYGLDAVSDVPLLLSYGRLMAGGARPYLDFGVEYPPLALPLFVPPAWVADATLAARAFNLEMWLLLAAAALATVAAAGRLAPGRDRRWATGIAFAAGFAALGWVSLNRYDAAVALCAALVLWLSARRRPALAAAAAGAAFAVKLVPAVLLLLPLLLATSRPGGPGPDLRAAVRALAAFAAAALLPFLPPLLLAPHGLARTFEHHLLRPLQVEAVPATPFLLPALLGGAPPAVASGFGSQNLTAPAALLVSRGCALLTLAALLAALALGWRRRAALLTRPEGPPLLALALLLAAVATGKVLSPQYLCWLLPPLALLWPERPRLAALVLGALALTHLEFPARYWAFVAMHPGPVALVVGRNLALAAALGLTLWHLWRLPAAGPSEALRQRPGGATVGA